MYCFKCGAQISDSSNFCRKCGARVVSVAENATATLEPPPLPAEQPHRKAQTSQPAPLPGDIARFAGFSRRAAALIIDSFVQMGIAVVLGAFLGLATAASDQAAEDGTHEGLYYIASWVTAWLYYALMHSSNWQATLGKRALGIKVTSLTGDRIGFGRATGRYFATLLSAISIGIGYLMAAFTLRKQALHDRIAGTLVVSRNATPEDIFSGLAPPKVSGAVIALGLVVGLIPLVGILAAIAIPAYQDYLIRSQVSEGLAMASEYKVGVAEALVNGADYTTIDNNLIQLPDTLAAKFVSSITVTGGAIQVTYGGQANAKIQEKFVTLVPGLTEAGDVVWTCGTASVPQGATVYLEDHEDYTSVAGKYLPAVCR